MAILARNAAGKRWNRAIAPLVAVASIAAAGPALADGTWVRGGVLENNVPVTFARYLSDEGEGQMTVRCSAGGFTIDAGAAGGGILPEGRAIGDTVEISFVLVGGAEPGATVASGPVRIRADGAVIVDLNSKTGAADLARLLLMPAERIDVTLGSETRPVLLGPDARMLFEAIAASCAGWPD